MSTLRLSRRPEKMSEVWRETREALAGVEVGQQGARQVTGLRIGLDGDRVLATMDAVVRNDKIAGQAIPQRGEAREGSCW